MTGEKFVTIFQVILYIYLWSHTLTLDLDLISYFLYRGHRTIRWSPRLTFVSFCLQNFNEQLSKTVLENDNCLKVTPYKQRHVHTRTHACTHARMHARTHARTQRLTEWQDILQDVTTFSISSFVIINHLSSASLCVWVCVCVCPSVCLSVCLCVCVV